MFAVQSEDIKQALSQYLSNKCIKTLACANTLPTFSQRPICEITEKNQTIGKYGFYLTEKVFTQHI